MTDNTMNNSSNTNDNIHEAAERAADLMTTNNPELDHLTESDRLRVQENIKEKLITAHKTEGSDVKELADKLESSLEKVIGRRVYENSP